MVGEQRHPGQVCRGQVYKGQVCRGQVCRGQVGGREGVAELGGESREPGGWGLPVCPPTSPPTKGGVP